MESRSVNSVDPLENIARSREETFKLKGGREDPPRRAGRPHRACACPSAGPASGVSGWEGGRPVEHRREQSAHRLPKDSKSRASTGPLPAPTPAGSLSPTHRPCALSTRGGVAASRRGRGASPGLKARSRTAALLGVCKQRTGWISGTPVRGRERRGGAGWPRAPRDPAGR